MPYPAGVVAIAVPSVPHRGPWTYDEVHDLLQHPDDGLRYELVDGELLVAASPKFLHQVCVTNLVIRLDAAAPRPLRALAGPVDWYVDRTTYLVPDLVVARRDAVDGPALVAPPALVVEVQSPGNRRDDLGVKFHAYARAGLPWYWVVDPAATLLRAFELVGGAFVERAAVRGDEPFVATQPFLVTFTPASLVD